MSLIGTLVIVFLLFYIAIYIFQMPGLGNVIFHNVWYILEFFFIHTPWAAILGISLVVFIIIFSALSWFISRRLMSLTKRMQQVATGDFKLKLNDQPKDEIDELSNSMAHMAAKIDAAFRAQAAAEKSRNELIVNFAHDLRTPLTSILGYLTYLNDEVEQKGNLKNQDIKKYLLLVQKKCQKLEKQINQLFELTKLTSGSLPLKPKVFPLRVFINQLVLEYSPILLSSGLKLNLVFPHHLQTVKLEADADLLNRVFANIFDNACRYAHDGKQVKFVIARRQPNQIKFEITTFANPIPQDQLKNVFNKLVRLETSRSEGTGGTGLGLAICQEIIDLHQGKIYATSDEKSTTFHLSLGINTPPITRISSSITLDTVAK